MEQNTGRALDAKTNVHPCYTQLKHHTNR
jgi:hypothetical protein